MKKLLVIIFMAISSVSYCQFLTTSEPKQEEKKPYSFVVQYREWESVWKQSGDAMYSEYQWTYKIQGFYTYDAMLKWLNSGNGWYRDNNQKIARLTESEFIAAYDLVKLEKLEFKFNKEHKTKDRQVVIEKDEWYDTYWSK